MATESSNNNPLVVRVDRDTRVRANFTEIGCGNVGDPCNLNGSPGTIVYDPCCEGLVCVGDAGNNNWFPGDQPYGECRQEINPPPEPPPTPRNTFVLRLSANITEGGRIEVRQNVGGTNVQLESTSAITRGTQFTWTATSEQIDPTIVATPATGYRFAGWRNISNATITSPNSTSQTIGIRPFSQIEEVEVEAVFEEIVQDTTVLVTVEDVPDQLGSVRILSPRPSPSTSDSITVTAGTVVSVEATPISDVISLVHWLIREGNESRGRILTTNSVASITATQNTVLTAVWEQVGTEISGCTNPRADNYNPAATRDDGSCIFPPVRGCTDPSAQNYNSQAEIDDGSCVYPDTWLSCMDTRVREGNPPEDYRLVPDVRPGGTSCWEPITEVGFTPSLRNLSFRYRRGSAIFPDGVSFTAQNPSYGLSYRVRLETNEQLFKITPREFVIGPRDNQTINISVNRNNINDFGDGVSNFDLILNIEEV